MTASEESTLIQRLQRGDPAALSELLAQHQHRLYNICLRIVGNREDAADVAQDAMIKAIEHLDRFRGEAQIHTWLTRIATNEALTHLRRRKVRRAVSLDNMGSHNGQDGHDHDGRAQSFAHSLADGREPSPEQRVQQQELGQQLQHALNQLEPDFRAVLVLRDIDQMDYQQIAEVLEIPVGTVKSRLFRARLALREHLTEAEQTPGAGRGA